MLSPCGGCDPHLAAAIVCYLSFFLSGCSIFLYWYWLSNYREEVFPLESRYPDADFASDCDALEPEPPDEEEDTAATFQTSDVSVSASTSHQMSISNICGNLEPETEFEPEPDSCDPFIINTISLPPPISPLDLDAIYSSPETPIEEGPEAGAHGEKPAVSNNPYLNGHTYKQNVLWGLHGILTNLAEALLAALFYSGLFEDNYRSALIWVIGFSSNFIIGNLLYFLLLIFATNRTKFRQLWIRWGIEFIFNTAKDLYFLWVGVFLLINIRDGGYNNYNEAN